MRSYSIFTRLVCLAATASLVCAFGAPVAVAATEDTGSGQESGSTTDENPEPTVDPTPEPVSEHPSVLVGKTFKKGGLRYKVVKATKKGKGTVAVVERTSGKTKASIPATVKKSYKLLTNGKRVSKSFTFKVKSIGKNAFNNKKGHKLRTLTIGENVVSIEKKAFYGCTSLTKITFKGKTIGTKTKMSGTKVTKSPIAKKAFAKTPRSCDVYTPKATGTNFAYKQGIRAAMSYAGFTGVVF